MSFISKILGGGAKQVLDGVDAGGGAKQVLDGVDALIGRFKASPEEKQAFKLELEKLLQQRDAEIEETIRAELQAKERVLVAELQQGDSYTKSYTKRARPTVVYVGLVFIFFNYVLVPTVQSFSSVSIRPFDLPTEFWAAWGGIVATWSIGRSAEKRGAKSKTISLITGND
jgi:hypothetical protein